MSTSWPRIILSQVSIRCGPRSETSGSTTKYSSGSEPARGLAFPGHEDPDYLDFFYHSAVVGMTSQVSDVTVHSRAMRRLVLLHGLLSFAFNLIVLAMAVNVFASALG